MHMYIHAEASCDTEIAKPRHLRVFFDDSFLSAVAAAVEEDSLRAHGRWLQVCMYVCMCVCNVCIYIYKSMYMYIFIYVCMCIYIHTHKHTYIYTYIYIHTYIHTHIHTYVQFVVTFCHEIFSLNKGAVYQFSHLLPFIYVYIYFMI